MLILLPLVVGAALAAPNCPPLGPVFEKPTNFKTSAAIRDAIANLTATLKARDADNSTGAFVTSYSIEVFSASTSDPIFSWHHTAPNLTAQATNNGTVVGVTKVDGNSVYRLGSLTKIFTALTWLAQDGDGKWNDPITKYIPELAAAADKAKDDPVVNLAWGDVTIGGLFSQLSGAVRDYGLLGEVTQQFNQNQAVSFGFPGLKSSDPLLPPCGEWPLCNRTEFFNGLLKVYPSYAPFTTPAYANTGFQILGYALESIKGKTFQSMMEESVLKPLGLNHTFYANPPDAVGVIPGDKSAAGWAYQLGEEDPAGNMYSSVHDLANLGRGILSSTVLSPAVTRRWLKPAALTSDPVAGVGYPWGVRRITLPIANGHRVFEAYNKAGRIGYYASLLALLPDYDVGIAVLIATPNYPANMNFNLADLLGGQLVPAFEAAAREQADAKYAGKYRFVSTGGNGTAALNSSLELTTQADRPGLGIVNWVSNGTDMGYLATVLQSGYEGVNPSVRLYPTGLETRRADGSRKVAFKATFEDLQAPARPGAMFSTDCGTWVAFASVTYGSEPLDQFIFEIDPAGKVVSIEPLALRAVLKKVG